MKSSHAQECVTMYFSTIPLGAGLAGGAYMRSSFLTDFESRRRHRPSHYGTDHVSRCASVRALFCTKCYMPDGT